MFALSAFSTPHQLTVHHRGARNVCYKRPVLSSIPLPSPAVIFITPRGFCGDPDRAVLLTGQALSGGASLVQIRDTNASEQQLRQIAHRLAQEFKDPSLFIMNGPLSLQVTQEIPRFGMHLREKDRKSLLSKAQSLACQDTYLGCSAHSVNSAVDALKCGPISYIQVGTMFETQSHPGKIPEGPTLLTDIRKKLKEEQTLIGVGGINASNTKQVIQHGAQGVAVISAICAASDPAKATREIVQAVNDACNRQIQRLLQR